MGAYQQMPTSLMPQVPLYPQVPFAPFPQAVLYPQVAMPTLPQNKSSKKKWLLGIAGFLALIAIAANKAEDNAIKTTDDENIYRAEQETNQPDPVGQSQA